MEFNNFPYHNYSMIISSLRNYSGDDAYEARRLADKLSNKEDRTLEFVKGGAIINTSIDLSDKDIGLINKSLKEHIMRFNRYAKSNTEENAKYKSEIAHLQNLLKQNAKSSSELKADIRMMKGLLTSRFPASKSSAKAPKSTKLPSNKMLNQRAFK